MYKLVGAVPLRKDMPRDEALRYWRDVHGPIVSKVPGLKKYVQNQAVTAPESDLQFDGTIELWFDSLEAYRAAMATPEWRAVMEDSAKFIDMDRLWVAPADEISVV